MSIVCQEGMRKDVEIVFEVLKDHILIFTIPDHSFTHQVLGVIMRASIIMHCWIFYGLGPFIE
jgi:hypothetical protein